MLEDVRCDMCEARVDPSDVFTCRECGCEFAVFFSDSYLRVTCPACGALVRSASRRVKEVRYSCNECGCNFSADREPHFCPSCGAEDFLIEGS